jgi:small-conductance mechanosensitive channel
MYTEFKYTIWYLALKLLGVYIIVIVINLLVLTGLLGVLENFAAWPWIVQGIALVINWGLVFMFASSDGRRDILVDSANAKRAQRHEGFTYKNVYDKNKGFIAGVLSQVPLALIFIVWLLVGSPKNGLMFFSHLCFSPYFQLVGALGLNIFTMLLFVALFSAMAGIAYLSAKSYQKKVLTIIKRNEEKAAVKGIVHKK